VSRLSAITRKPGELLRRPAARATRKASPQVPAKPDAGKEPEKPEESAELLAQRDRLLEKFTVMQADLGGAFYEMAIRDHVRLDVLTRKAAELQRVDAELLAVERVLELQRNDAAGLCPSCGAPYAPGVRFCAQCGNPLVPVAPPTAPAPAPAPVHPTPPIPESSPLPQPEGVVPPAVEPQSHLMRPPGQASQPGPEQPTEVRR
jgi:hypothetical protein